MTRRDILIALRLYAMYIVYEGIISLPFNLNLGIRFMGSEHPGNELIFIICCLSFILTMSVAFLIWKCSTAFVNKESSLAQCTRVIETEDALKIAFPCMGLFFIINGVWGIPNILFAAYQNVQGTPDSADFVPLMMLISTVLVILFGLRLVAPLPAWVRLIRQAGRPIK